MKPRLSRSLGLSIAAAIATIALKIAAWLLTGSVGLFSDAAESIVNLVSAVVALVALHWASKPADADHAYGHEKAEYLSAGAEGSLIFVAALTILAAAIHRLLEPQGLDHVEAGLAASAAASVINAAVGWRMRDRPIPLAVGHQPDVAARDCAALISASAPTGSAPRCSAITGA